jgi:hypothetical protein
MLEACSCALPAMCRHALSPCCHTGTVCHELACGRCSLQFGQRPPRFYAALRLPPQRSTGDCAVCLCRDDWQDLPVGAHCGDQRPKHNLRKVQDIAEGPNTGGHCPSLIFVDAMSCLMLLLHLAELASA